MKIRYLIDALTQMELDSDQGEETEVTITIHSCQWNTSGFYIEKTIDDLTMEFGPKDKVSFELVLQRTDLDELGNMRTELEEHSLIEPPY